MKKICIMFALAVAAVMLFGCNASNPSASNSQSPVSGESSSLTFNSKGVAEYFDSEEASPYVGTWVSEVDPEAKIVLKEDGTGLIGEKECQWVFRANGYGTFAIKAIVDEGAGEAELLIEDGRLLGNAHTSKMPDYIPFAATFGRFFDKAS